MIKRVTNYLRKHGIKATIKKILEKVATKLSEKITVTQDDKLYTEEQVNWRLIAKPLNTINDPAPAGKRLNLVIDTMNESELFGGVATELILATEFCNRYDIPLRVITRQGKPQPHNYYKILELNKLTAKIDVSFALDHIGANDDDHSTHIFVHDDDIFLASSWWTARAIRQTFPNRKFFYIIQETETFFYEHGYEHYLCSQMMDDPNISYIVNSKFLFDYFKEYHPRIAAQGAYFHPAFSSNLFTAGKFEQKEKYNLFFYSRPNNARNLDSYGKEILDFCIAHGIIDTDKWEIVFAGSKAAVPIFSNGYTGTHKGIMSWREYAGFLQTVDLALSLMYTPHPSYPPYDVACSGGVVISNQCKNKLNFEQSNNVILADLEFSSMVEAIKTGIALAQDIPQRKHNYENATIPRNWHDTLKSAIDYMGEQI